MPEMTKPGSHGHMFFRSAVRVLVQFARERIRRDGGPKLVAL